jgi:putative polymerase
MRSSIVSAPSLRMRVMQDRENRNARARHVQNTVLKYVAGGVLFAALCFNPLLAIVNANIVPLTQNIVVLSEMIIVSVIALLVISRLTPIYLPWLAMSCFIILLGFLISATAVLVNPDFGMTLNIKAIRDMLLIPVFIMAGIVYAQYGGNMLRLFLALHTLVLLVTFFEAFAIDAYGQFFNVMAYYINTRDFEAESFWNPDSILFISATRPDLRFLFNSLNLHRMSSLFLEPVSLGNYVIIATAVAAAFWKQCSRMIKIYLPVSIFILLVASDGRLATVACLAILIVMAIVQLLPRYSYALYLPATVLFAFIAVWLLGFQPTGDNFPGRIAFSVQFLQNLSFIDYLGFNPEAYSASEDSGVSHLVLNQSLPGFIIIWALIMFLHPQRTRTSIVFMHGLSLYFALSLIVSYAPISIKTAALLWFVYGFTYAKDYAFVKKSRLNS